MNTTAVKTRENSYYQICLDEERKETYLTDIVPTSGKTVGQLTARLANNPAWMAKAFMTNAPIDNIMVAQLARHIHKQCVVLGVPFFLFEEGIVFFQRVTAKYWGTWAISALRLMAQKQGLPMIDNGFKVLYHIPEIDKILGKQEEYLDAISRGRGEDYATISLRDVLGGERKQGAFLIKRGGIVIMGAEVHYAIEGHPQTPIYFGVDFSKTKLSGPYGSYQQAVVRTKAIRHTMQTYYGPILPEIETVDEAAGGDITEGVSLEAALGGYDIGNYKDARREELRKSSESME